MTEIVPIGDVYVAPLPKTVRGFAAVRDGRVLAHGGVYLDRDRYVMYGFAAEAGLREPRALIRLARRIIATAGARRIPLQAMADPNVEPAPRFLEHFGFRKLAGNLYQWEGE